MWTAGALQCPCNSLPYCLELVRRGSTYGKLAHDTAEFGLCADQHIRALNFINTLLGLVGDILNLVPNL